MEVNNITGFSSSCTSQSESNCSGAPIYECMDSYPGHIITTLYIYLNALLLMPLNCCIMWLVRRTAGIGSSDFVIFNQSFAEVIGEVSLISFGIGIMLKKIFLILISVYMCSTFMVGRPLFQTFFCVERYLAVVHPLVYLKYTKAPKLKVPIVGLIWLIIIIFGCFIVYSYPKMPILLYMSLFVMLLLVCITCSVMILWVLKRPKPGDGEREGAYQLKRKAFISVTVILITLVFGYGTVACIIVLRNQLSYNTYCVVLGLGWWTFLPSSAVQPYLYLSKVDKIPCTKNL